MVKHRLPPNGPALSYSLFIFVCFGLQRGTISIIIVMIIRGGVE